MHASSRGLAAAAAAVGILSGLPSQSYAQQPDGAGHSHNYARFVQSAEKIIEKSRRDGEFSGTPEENGLSLSKPGNYLAANEPLPGLEDVIQDCEPGTDEKIAYTGGLKWNNLRIKPGIRSTFDGKLELGLGVEGLLPLYIARDCLTGRESLAGFQLSGYAGRKSVEIYPGLVLNKVYGAGNDKSLLQAAVSLQGVRTEGANFGGVEFTGAYEKNGLKISIIAGVPLTGAKEIGLRQDIAESLTSSVDGGITRTARTTTTTTRHEYLQARPVVTFIGESKRHISFLPEGSALSAGLSWYGGESGRFAEEIKAIAGAKLPLGGFGKKGVYLSLGLRAGPGGKPEGFLELSIPFGKDGILNDKGEQPTANLLYSMARREGMKFARYSTVDSKTDIKQSPQITSGQCPAEGEVGKPYLCNIVAKTDSDFQTIKIPLFLAMKAEGNIATLFGIPGQNNIGDHQYEIAARDKNGLQTAISGLIKIAKAPEPPVTPPETPKINFIQPPKNITVAAGTYVPLEVIVANLGNNALECRADTIKGGAAPAAPKGCVGNVMFSNPGEYRIVAAVNGPTANNITDERIVTVTPQPETPKLEIVEPSGNIAVVANRPVKIAVKGYNLGNNRLECGFKSLGGGTAPDAPKGCVGNVVFKDAGTYEFYATISGLAANIIEKKNIEVENILEASCRASPLKAEINEPVTWIAEIKGGAINSKNYGEWSIPDGKVGKISGLTATVTYSTPGKKNAEITAMTPSGLQKVIAACQGEVLPLHKITINDVIVTTGNSGTTSATLEGRLDRPAADRGVTVDYTTFSGGNANDAQPNRDYQPIQGTLTFRGGEVAKPIIVKVIDQTDQPDRVVWVKLSKSVYATIDRDTGKITIKYPSSPPNDDDGTCFTADTKLVMSNGSFKEISMIRIGDKVKSFDFVKNRKTNGKVTALFTFDKGSFLRLNGLKVTEKHPFAVGADKWEEAGNLKVGDQVLGDNKITIKNIERVNKPVSVFNITVNGMHNYYVDDNENTFLVHNKGPLGGCFIKESKVMMADGKAKNIEKIRIGDEVLGFNKKAKKWEKYTVTEKQVVKNKKGYFIINKKLKVSPLHRIYVNGKSKTAPEIELNDTIINGHKKAKVTSIELIEKKADRYNIVLGRNRDVMFMVNGILVYNGW